MMNAGVSLLICFFILSALVYGAPVVNSPDTIATSRGNLILYCLEHGSLRFDYRGIVIYIDPIAHDADMSKMPKADIILITHEHQDHLNEAVIRRLSGEKTLIILNKSSFEILKSGIVIANGETKTIKGITIEAVPAYNFTPGRDKAHPRGRDNGYILTIGGKRIYVAGDTENTQEMKALSSIDIAFLPMNLPWTMSPEQVADAAKAFKPKILYPYHTGETDVSRLTALMKDVKDIEVRIKNMR